MAARRLLRFAPCREEPAGGFFCMISGRQKRYYSSGKLSEQADFYYTGGRQKDGCKRQKRYYSSGKHA